MQDLAEVVRRARELVTRAAIAHRLEPADRIAEHLHTARIA
jgi:hypothetical protein